MVPIFGFMLFQGPLSSPPMISREVEHTSGRAMHRAAQLFVSRRQGSTHGAKLGGTPRLDFLQRLSTRDSRGLPRRTTMTHLDIEPLCTTLFWLPVACRFVAVAARRAS